MFVCLLLSTLCYYLVCCYFFAVVVVGSVGIVLFLSLYSIFPLDSLKASLKHGRSFFIRSFNIVIH